MEEKKNTWEALWISQSRGIGSLKDWDLIIGLYNGYLHLTILCPRIKKQLQGIPKGENKTILKQASKPGRDIGMIRLGVESSYD